MPVDRESLTQHIPPATQARANSTLKHVKGYSRTTLTTERLSGLALINIHYEKPVYYDKRRKARLIEQLGTIYISNISEGTAFLLQGVTKNDSKSETLQI